ncbi:response regulator transcription factor [Granulicella arctica]|uniref:response regulator transcription factor n=1 Tax=Granulicella arctica TaxID=940613 RepID=UPI0021DF860C|nr:response regulator [Granulicella arctica]
MQRILVVDDERLVADTLTLIFNKHGFEARAVYSAEDGIVAARSFKPELLLCDISMPGRDGTELMQQVSLELPDCRILVLTGNYSNLKRVREQSQMMSRPANILTKPCQPAELLRQAGALLAS